MRVKWGLLKSWWKLNLGFEWELRMCSGEENNE
jgi:hypothetical protein